MALTDTYDRRVQLEASRLRYRDAIHLQKAERWNGAIYLGGYAIECSLKALICFGERKDNLKDTKIFKRGIVGAALHNLWPLSQESQVFQQAILLDRSGTLKPAWTTIIELWRKDELRYGAKLVKKVECERFIKAIQVLHPKILQLQREDL